MNKDEKKYLEEIMKCRMLKFLHIHIIAYGNILLRHNLLKPFPGKAFTLEESHGAATRRFRKGGFGRVS